ncbi:glucosamine inositolphosphorylceramide transferase family protein [Mucilaginibacter xinganensis]|uniref:Glucosamine inositolphosphorylceramide transferase 1 N-terminal domain-containing protein n=1 Tax=Mucilaginibacter xinganensis TaxID=1234841 RepID=A0A223NY94_9SPHI|nr:hypothetical protein [Mucilaginibacter xinganensis]ASU34750.1 hypothetical protein MuYL_2863 [Mucilaginibacter xinganensis]
MNPSSPLIKAFYKLFAHDKWNIGYLYQTPESLIQSKKLNGPINWFKEDKADYSADPFAVKIKGNTYLYYEELNFWKGKGEIMMLDCLNFKNKKRVSGIMKQQVHLSYPHIIKENNDLYCIPETSAAQQIALYKVDKEAPTIFKKIKVVLKGSEFVDSSIIKYGGKYWLFTSISKKPDHLYIFSADSLLGMFKPHSLNPIKVEPCLSRSAGGLFIVDNRLYMPSQNHQKCYGGSIIINEITLLNQTEFKYTSAFEILPQLPYGEGLHTINFSEGLLLVDGKRKVFSSLAPVKKLVKKLRLAYNL